MSLELFCYQADCGDAIRMRYLGEDNKPHNIFLDSGYERTFRTILRKEIHQLIQAEESIDLWVVSHIHDDHIGGVLKYIHSVRNEEIVDITKSWFYNPPIIDFGSPNLAQLDSSSAMSIRQGNLLSKFLASKNKLTANDIDTDFVVPDLYGLKMTILSPTKTTMNELREKYKQNIPFQSNELDDISHATSISNYDYDKRIDEFVVDEFTEDVSLENRSCISMLIEYKNAKMLWLADAHPSIVMETLSKRGYSEKNPLICSYVLLSHHASKKNNSSLLFSMIKCDKFIISCNGENKHCLPNKEVLARIIRHRSREISTPYSFFFNYDTFNLNRIFEVDGADVFQRWNFNIIYSSKPYINIVL